jgi:uncharacterized membrane protein required for colicin V production
MNGLDIILGFVILGVTALQAFRGFGRAVFDGLGLYGALWISSTAASTLNGSVHVAATSGANQAFLFIVMFMVVGALALLLSRFVYGSILLNLGVFDHFLGLLVGLACGVIIAHGIVQGIDLDSHGSGSPSMVASSNIGSECLNFSSYHSFVDILSSETSGHDVKTD